MKQIEDYSQLNDAEAFYKAINDCKAYLGNAKFESIVNSMKEESVKPTLQAMHMMLGLLAGIEGYPVKAMYQFAFGFDSVKDEDLTKDPITVELLDESDKPWAVIKKYNKIIGTKLTLEEAERLLDQVKRTHPEAKIVPVCEL